MPAYSLKTYVEPALIQGADCEPDDPWVNRLSEPPLTETYTCPGELSPVFQLMVVVLDPAGTGLGVAVMLATVELGPGLPQDVELAAQSV